LPSRARRTVSRSIPADGYSRDTRRAQRHGAPARHDAPQGPVGTTGVITEIRRDLHITEPDDARGWRHSPTGERPYPHALPPTASAPAYLSVPTGAELIKLLMRGLLFAVPAEEAEPLGSISRMGLAVASEVHNRRPVPVRRDHTLPPARTVSAVATGTPQRRGERRFVSAEEEESIVMQPCPYHRLTHSIENVAGAERRGGTDDHRVLLQSTNIIASNMPAGYLQPIHALFGLTRNLISGAGSSNCTGRGHDSRIGQ